MLFVIGGNGSHAGANAIHEEVNTSTSFFIP
jgi:6-phosphofructokinase